MPNPITPTCPNCNYDLAGLIEPGPLFTCPECGNKTTYEFAASRISRARAIRWAIYLLFALPVPISGWSYFIFTQWEYEEDGLFAVGFIPGVLLIYYIPITTIVLLIRELIVRKRVSKHHINPSIWVSLFWILVPAAISLWFSFSIIILWAEALAGV